MALECLRCALADGQRTYAKGRMKKIEIMHLAGGTFCGIKCKNIYDRIQHHHRTYIEHEQEIECKRVAAFEAKKAKHHKKMIYLIASFLPVPRQNFSNSHPSILALVNHWGNSRLPPAPPNPPTPPTVASLLALDVTPRAPSPRRRRTRKKKHVCIARPTSGRFQWCFGNAFGFRATTPRVRSPYPEPSLAGRTLPPLPVSECLPPPEREQIMPEVITPVSRKVGGAGYCWVEVFPFLDRSVMEMTAEEFAENLVKSHEEDWRSDEDMPIEIRIRFTQQADGDFHVEETKNTMKEEPFEKDWYNYLSLRKHILGIIDRDKSTPTFVGKPTISAREEAITVRSAGENSDFWLFAEAPEIFTQAAAKYARHIGLTRPGITPSPPAPPGQLPPISILPPPTQPDNLVPIGHIDPNLLNNTIPFMQPGADAGPPIVLPGDDAATVAARAVSALDAQSAEFYRKAMAHLPSEVQVFFLNFNNATKTMMHWAGEKLLEFADYIHLGAFFRYTHNVEHIIGVILSDVAKTCLTAVNVASHVSLALRLIALLSLNFAEHHAADHVFRRAIIEGRARFSDHHEYADVIERVQRVRFATQPPVRLTHMADRSIEVPVGPIYQEIASRLGTNYERCARNADRMPKLILPESLPTETLIEFQNCAPEFSVAAGINTQPHPIAAATRTVFRSRISNHAAELGTPLALVGGSLDELAAFPTARHNCAPILSGRDAKRYHSRAGGKMKHDALCHKRFQDCFEPPPGDQVVALFSAHDIPPREFIPAMVARNCNRAFVALNLPFPLLDQRVHQYTDNLTGLHYEREDGELYVFHWGEHTAGYAHKFQNVFEWMTNLPVFQGLHVQAECIGQVGTSVLLQLDVNPGSQEIVPTMWSCQREAFYILPELIDADLQRDATRHFAVPANRFNQLVAYTATLNGMERDNQKLAAKLRGLMAEVRVGKHTVDPRWALTLPQFYSLVSHALIAHIVYSESVDKGTTRMLAYYKRNSWRYGSFLQRFVQRQLDLVCFRSNGERNPAQVRSAAHAPRHTYNPYVLAGEYRLINATQRRSDRVVPVHLAVPFIKNFSGAAANVARRWGGTALDAAGRLQHVVEDQISRRRRTRRSLDLLPAAARSPIRTTTSPDEPPLPPLPSAPPDPDPASIPLPDDDAGLTELTRPEKTRLDAICRRIRFRSAVSKSQARWRARKRTATPAAPPVRKTNNLGVAPFLHNLRLRDTRLRLLNRWAKNWKETQEDIGYPSDEESVDDEIVLEHYGHIDEDPDEIVSLGPSLPDDLHHADLEAAVEQGKLHVVRADCISPATDYPVDFLAQFGPTSNKLDTLWRKIPGGLPSWVGPTKVPIAIKGAAQQIYHAFRVIPATNAFRMHDLAPNHRPKAARASVRRAFGSASGDSEKDNRLNEKLNKFIDVVCKDVRDLPVKLLHIDGPPMSAKSTLARLYGGKYAGKICVYVPSHKLRREWEEARTGQEMFAAKAVVKVRFATFGTAGPTDFAPDLGIIDEVYNFTELELALHIRALTIAGCTKILLVGDHFQNNQDAIQPNSPYLSRALTMNVSLGMPRDAHALFCAINSVQGQYHTTGERGISVYFGEIPLERPPLTFQTHEYGGNAGVDLTIGKVQGARCERSYLVADGNLLKMTWLTSSQSRRTVAVTRHTKTMYIQCQHAVANAFSPLPLEEATYVEGRAEFDQPLAYGGADVCLQAFTFESTPSAAATFEAVAATSLIPDAVAFGRSRVTSDHQDAFSTRPCHQDVQNVILAKTNFALPDPFDMPVAADSGDASFKFCPPQPVDRPDHVRCSYENAALMASIQHGANAVENWRNLLERQLGPSTAKKPRISQADWVEGRTIYERFKQCYYAPSASVYVEPSAQVWAATRNPAGLATILRSEPFGETSRTFVADAEFKTQSKAKAKPGFAATLPYGQSIIANAKNFNAYFADSQPRIYQNLARLLRKDVICDYGMTDDELSFRVAQLGVAKALNGPANLQADLEKQDSSHSAPLLVAFYYIALDCGAEVDKMQLYLQYCSSYSFAARTADRTRGTVSFNLGSGDPFTLIRNNIMELCVIACTYERADQAMIIEKGDDVHGVFYDLTKRPLLPSIAACKLTVEVGAAGYHAGRFHTGERYVVDPVRAFMKHCTRLHDPAVTLDSLWKSYISRATNYSQEEIEFLTAACQEHYPFFEAAEIVTVIDFIIALRDRSFFRQTSKFSRTMVLDTQQDCLPNCVRLLRPGRPPSFYRQFRKLHVVDAEVKLRQEGIPFVRAEHLRELPVNVIALTSTHARVRIMAFQND